MSDETDWTKINKETSLTLREKIINRVEEIKNNPTLGSGLFNKQGKFSFPHMGTNIIINNWGELSDQELIETFEVLIMRAYRQR